MFKFLYLLIFIVLQMYVWKGSELFTYTSKSDLSCLKKFSPLSIHCFSISYTTGMHLSSEHFIIGVLLKTGYNCYTSTKTFQYQGYAAICILPVLQIYSFSPISSNVTLFPNETFYWWTQNWTLQNKTIPNMIPKMIKKKTNFEWWNRIDRRWKSKSI